MIACVHVQLTTPSLFHLFLFLYFCNLNLLFCRTGIDTAWIDNANDFHFILYLSLSDCSYFDGGLNVYRCALVTNSAAFSLLGGTSCALHKFQIKIWLTTLAHYYLYHHCMHLFIMDWINYNVIIILRIKLQTYRIALIISKRTIKQQ